MFAVAKLRSGVVPAVVPTVAVVSVPPDNEIPTPPVVKNISVDIGTVAVGQIVVEVFDARFVFVTTR